MFLEISGNSQENTCARVSFSIKLQAEATFLTEHLWCLLLPSARYYQKKNKGGIKKNFKRYQDLSEEEKKTSSENKYKNLPEEQKQRLVE